MSELNDEMIFHDLTVGLISARVSNEGRTDMRFSDERIKELLDDYHRIVRQFREANAEQ